MCAKPKRSGYRRRSRGSGGGGAGGNGANGDAIVTNGVRVQKTSIDLNTALGGTNPNYGRRGSNGRRDAYTCNCQRCSFVYEMRRRGYDVEADEYNGTDSVCLGWRSAFEGQNYERLGATRKTQVESLVHSKLDQWGNGARAIVYVAWDGGSAHVFNVEKTAQGDYYSFDGQTGQYNVLGRYASRCRPSKVMIARVDNLAPSRLYLDGAIKRS